MDLRFTSNLLLLLISAALSTRLAYYAWKRRPATGSTLFALLMLAVTQWSLAYALELSGTTLASKLVWAKFQYLGVSLLPVAWLIFVLEFTGKEKWITRRNIVLLAIIPTSTFLLAVTNEVHGWIWQQTSLSLSSGTVAALQVEYGFWFWVHTVFSYGCLAVASIRLISSWRREVAALYRWQTIALLFGLLLPWIANALYVTRTTSQDLTTLTFLISGVALVHYTLRFYLFDIAPVAHHAIFNSMSEAIIVLDTQDRIADVNPIVTQIMNMPATDMIGKSFKSVLPNLFEGPVSGQEKPFEVKFGTTDDPIFYEVTVSPLSDWRRSERGHLLVLHDISQRKRIDKLRQDMTHSMVYDLRDPLSNSLFGLEMLKGDVSEINSPESDQLWELTFAQTMKTLNLVDSILEVDHIGPGRETPITRTTVHLSELIEKVLNEHESHIRSKGLSFSFNQSEDLPYAWADMDVIERVLQKLIDNSIRFSPAGGTISLDVQVKDQGEQLTSSPRLLVSVSDEGPGISPEIQERIFDKFVAGPNKRSGSGLGLAFCKMAMMAHGENIWVESEPGRGSRFVFSLPVAAQPALPFLHA